MADANRDGNGVPVAIGLLNTDGSTIKELTAVPTTNILNVANGTSGSDFNTDDNALRDDNNVPTMMAVSSTDGETPVQLYVNSLGDLLVDST